MAEVTELLITYIIEGEGSYLTPSLLPIGYVTVDEHPLMEMAKDILAATKNKYASLIEYDEVVDETILTIKHRISKTEWTFYSIKYADSILEFSSYPDPCLSIEEVMVIKPMTLDEIRANREYLKNNLDEKFQSIKV